MIPGRGADCLGLAFWLFLRPRHWVFRDLGNKMIYRAANVLGL